MFMDSQKVSSNLLILARFDIALSSVHQFFLTMVTVILTDSKPQLFDILPRAAMCSLVFFLTLFLL